MKQLIMPENPLKHTMMFYDTEREKIVVEKLEKQLSEANEILKDVICQYPNQNICIYEYLRKWGVK